MGESRNDREIDVVVLGAGLAGLAAAERVLSQGRKVCVIEKEDFVGGMSASIRRDGYTFDFGGHRFLPHHPQTTEYVRGLFTDGDLLLRPRRSQIYLRDRYFNYPPEAMDLLKKIGLATSLRCALQGAGARLKQALLREPNRSLEDWMLCRFGHGLYDIYFGPYSEKLWGVSPSLVSADWAPQRISVPSIGIVIQNLLRFSRRDKIKTYATRFLYPVGGIGRIAEALSERIRGQGGTLLMGQAVTNIQRLPEGYQIETVSKSRGKGSVLARDVISTIPLPEFIGIMQPRPAPAVLEAARALTFRSVRFLNIMVEGHDVTHNTWLYVPEKRFVFFRIQEMNHWCPRNAPSGRTGLILEVACAKGDDLWRMPDEALLGRALVDLKTMGFDIQRRVLGVFSTFAEHAYPFYSLNYKKSLGVVYEFVRSLPHLTISGRQGLFRYANMDLAIEMGQEGADALNDSQRRDKLLALKPDKEYVESHLALSLRNLRWRSRPKHSL